MIVIGIITQLSLIISNLFNLTKVLFFEKMDFSILNSIGSARARRGLQPLGRVRCMSGCRGCSGVISLVLWPIAIYRSILIFYYCSFIDIFSFIIVVDLKEHQHHFLV